jgi:uncharacterized membrane protein
VIAPVIAVAALTWLALLVVSPLGPTSFAALMYGIGGFICHQIPERSFHLAGFQIPVCARCLGIYAGFAAVACVHVAAASRLAASRPRGLTPSSRGLTPSAARWVFLVSALPTAVTLGLEWGAVWRGSNLARAIAGAALGIGVALVVMSAVATLHYSACERRRPTEPSQLPPHI